MHDEFPAELLLPLLDACDDIDAGATRLAERTEIEALRSFLFESAEQYRRAAQDLRTVGRIDTPRASVHRQAIEVPGDATDVASTLERAECEALTYFRDAYDGNLPAPIAETVKRHYEAGVERLERLRALQTRLG
jgi:hypothetical protein